MIGIKENEVMELLKPMYGQVDAPRGWFLEASSRIMACGFRPHPLDPCVFLSYSPTGELDGFVTLHVDDLLGAGDVTRKEDGTYFSRVAALKESFKFKVWQQKDKFEHLGTNYEYDDSGALDLTLRDYSKKLKPATVNANL